MKCLPWPQLGQECHGARSLGPERGGIIYWTTRATTQCNANQCNDRHNSITEAVPLVLPCCTVRK